MKLLLLSKPLLLIILIVIVAGHFIPLKSKQYVATCGVAASADYRVVWSALELKNAYHDYKASDQPDLVNPTLQCLSDANVKATSKLYLW